MTAPQTDPMCPKCGSAMWNNIATKRNPRAPDFKCRDKNCDGCVWPPKAGRAPNEKLAAPTGPQAYSAGPHIAGLDAPKTETGAPPAETPVGEVSPALQKLLDVYSICWSHADELSHETLGAARTHEGMSSMAATMLIQAAQTGLIR